jgi:hypothetical protein
VPLANASWRSSLLSGLEPTGPPWVAFGYCLCGSASSSDYLQLSLLVWLLQEPSDLSGLDSDSPLWLACKISLKFPMTFNSVMVSAEILILWIVILIWLPTSYYVKFMIFQLLLNYCSLFWSWKCFLGVTILLISNINKSINIILAFFCSWTSTENPGVCAILLRLCTSTEHLKRVYTSPGPFMKICYFT